MDDIRITYDKHIDEPLEDDIGMGHCFSESHLDQMREEEEIIEEVSFPEEPRMGLKVLFLSSDTGGGHRASAESLGKQFQLLFPRTTYELLDVVEKDGVPPYNSLVSAYKHLSNRPSQWKLVYSVSNSRAFEVLADAHLKLMCERAVRRRIKSYNPDVVVSVHPLMTNVPVLSCSKISAETGKHLPIFTVVTDLGSAHCLWFANGVEKMFVGSEVVKELAKARGKVPEEKLILSGLPIRHDFAVQAELLGDRYSPAGRAYQRKVRQELKLPPMEESESTADSSLSQGTYGNVDRATLLLMGGGEGVGSLQNIADALYVELTSQGIDALILVVCGRNETLKSYIDNRKWEDVYKAWHHTKNRDLVTNGLMSISLADACVPGKNVLFPMVDPDCIGSGIVTGKIRQILARGSQKVGNAMTVPFPDKKSSVNKENIGVDKDSKVSCIATTIPDEIDGKNDKKMTENELHEASHDKQQINSDDVVETSISSPSKEDGEEEHLSSSFHLVTSLDGNETRLGNVTVVGLGFVDRMAEYMVAADILISKAGPGTISEAAALSLPIILTSYLPGQEEGNVEYVINAGFGSYCDVSDPSGIAEEVCMWLHDEVKMESMSKNARAKGTPYAARDIARTIGESTLRWLEHNEEVAHMRREQQQQRGTVGMHALSSSLSSVGDFLGLSTSGSSKLNRVPSD